MKRLISIVFICMFVNLTFASSDSIKTPLGNLEFKGRGKIFINDQEIQGPIDSEGHSFKLYQERLIGINKDWDKYFLLNYLVRSSDGYYSTTYYLVLDVSGNKPIFSNAIILSSDPDFLWGDNNYIYVRDGILFFGVYKPARKQFIYKEGILSENTGKWAGPAKPEKYIEPENPGPCYNVAGGYDECIKDLERNKKKAKQ
ncbi:MAG: hypothetical protein M0P19_07490 [Nevskia sp.]|nr:hypothetical protein [Nevskia sp.]MCK9384995.1 hypothetical protein [Nevskia sp.]